MVNIEDFIKRLEYLLEYYSMNAASFADKIGVQRSSLSHLLSGRNKPSLDFILKIIEAFPDVDLYWILIGKGNFPKEKHNNLEHHFTPAPSENEIVDLFSEFEKKPLPELIDNDKNRKPNFSENNPFNDEVAKIVFFYKNGTFTIFNHD
ncbi:helix-turn-helix transcriptional regulator [Flavobacterium sp.]|uniref:helix-turn-helix domain-containing protein n=1 Tax=Flavobacterium sp. TaxID=239 RepID=UPI0022BB31FA|nr:helix-turn-helix transcriptional regulator [Flavobacterium sp.]MCZ8228559.1 helix-turn-helix transcriptional regulator [Flavobacterium sp.]